MKTPYVDPLIPPHETNEETLTRLSANIGTLTGLMNDSERVGDYYLATMFNRTRDAKVAQAEEIIARVTAEGSESVEDRRFLLVHDAASAGDAPIVPYRKLVQPSGQLALPQ